MFASEVCNHHVFQLIKAAMLCLFTMVDMAESFVKDMADSGIMSDNVVLLHIDYGRDNVAAS